MSKIFEFFRPKFATCLNIIRQHSQESFLTGTSAQYLEDLYNSWLKDPKSVNASWDGYFKSFAKPNSLASSSEPAKRPSSSPSVAAPEVVGQSNIDLHLAMQTVVRSFQARGHLLAQLDPLGIATTEASWTHIGTPPSELVKKFKFEDLDQVVTLTDSTFIGGKDKKLPIREILKRLEEVYCRSIGVEYMYIDNLHERRFIREKLESPGSLYFTHEQKKVILRRLLWSSEFENFLGKKWASEKRFGLEGCDTFIPGMKAIIDVSTALGCEHFFLGNAHRGRLNVLSNIFQKPLYQIFNQFAPLDPGDDGAGDVKYHYGCHTERTNITTRKKYKLTMMSNASHLETVNACVLGRTRAEQIMQGDVKGQKNMAILIHGDAAFSGQGSNYECLGLSYLPDYTTHGIICFIINNQIGFTTDPRFSRSSRYCSDLARVVNAPIFHVNADDVESVVRVCQIAAEYRFKFHKDVVIDLVGYRRHGHNEGDEPMFTQPVMYTKIKQLKPVMVKYTEQLVGENVVTSEEVKKIQNEVHQFMEKQFVKATKQTTIYIKDWIDTLWTGFYNGKDPLKTTPTGVAEEILQHIGNKFSSPPPANLDFVVHPKLLKLLEDKKKMVENRMADWSLGEAFAIGSLVKEGIPVRLSGEDVQRGTFSHRHHVIHHQTKDKVTYIALQNLFPNQAPYFVCNSSLSEFGVLAFETGYAQANPNCLVIWEAQFGDFFNGAQPIFDQYLCSGESKWGRQNGIVVLLPHGFEGMGSEHSHARPERFLQMCEDDPDTIPELTPDFAIKQLFNCNWVIANPSNPANMFHLLRRQIYLSFRKPLLILTPKSLLRLRECRSSFNDMIEGTEFLRMIPEEGEACKNQENVKKLMFCSGKVYYDIIRALKKHNVEKEIAVARVEQISPFPYDLVKEECEKYPKATIWWAQEEPKNYGAYTYVLLRMNTLLQEQRKVNYLGRPVAASPATGIKKQHLQEVQTLEQEFVAM